MAKKDKTPQVWTCDTFDAWRKKIAKSSNRPIVQPKNKKRAQKDPREQYRSYLGSEHWQCRRKRVLEKANGICERCKTQKAIQVHHLTYKRIFNERDSDLQAVCMDCHRKAHPDKNF